MKAYLPLIYAAAGVVVIFAALFCVTPLLKSAQDDLNEQIDEQVARAQAMLESFDPTDADLHPAAENLATQPEHLVDIQSADYANFMDYLKRRGELITDALGIIKPAVAKSKQSGDQTISGADHEGATRLETILIYYQGDLFARQAAAQRAVADKAGSEFGHWLALWQEIDAQLRALNREISAAESRPAEDTTKTAAERVTALRAERDKVQAAIADAQQQVDQLKGLIGEQQKRHEAATAQAQTAQKRMLELEQKGIDATDPKSLPQFESEYTAASQQYRKATREAAILLAGAADQPVMNDAEKEAMTDPVITIEPGLEHQQRGLTALHTDLQSAETLVETRQALAAQIDRQIDKISKREQEVKALLAQFEKDRTALAEKATITAKAAMTAAVEADRLQSEAINLVSGQGKQAAQRAQRAVENRINNARTKSSENPDSPNPRFTMIAADRFISGHAKTLNADLDYLLASIQYQRLGDLNHHQQFLDRCEQMHLDPAKLLPDGFAADADHAWATQPKAVAAAADAARAATIKAAEDALKGYKEADSDVGQIWVLHTNMAAMDYLLSKITPKAEAKKHATDAIRQYETAIRGHDHPEARRYQRIIDELRRTSQ